MYPHTGKGGEKCLQEYKCCSPQPYFRLLFAVCASPIQPHINNSGTYVLYPRHLHRRGWKEGFPVLRKQGMPSKHKEGAGGRYVCGNSSCGHWWPNIHVLLFTNFLSTQQTGTYCHLYGDSIGMDYWSDCKVSFNTWFLTYTQWLAERRCQSSMEQSLLASSSYCHLHVFFPHHSCCQLACFNPDPLPLTSA